jgi:hypothetical protein
MKSLRLTLGLAVLVVAAALPVDAAPITVLVGDKDGFGLGLTPGQQIPCLTADADPSNPALPCLAPIHDLRDAAEILATDGAQITDSYSALYSGVEDDCPTGCTPNGEIATVVFPFAGQLGPDAAITTFIGDFQSSLFNAMTATINGIPISFFFDDGLRNTSLQTLVLTPAMLDAANLAGQVTLFLDHRAFVDPLNPANNSGSFDYVAFDYFELNAPAAPQPIPEPGTLLLLGAGLSAIAARSRVRALAGKQSLKTRFR